MQAAVVTEMPAVGARERLVEFVGEMAAGLRHARRRENTLIYVRGLIEHGGARACSRRCFGSARTARAMSLLQQFLGDSPWDWALLVRACAERVAPQIGVGAWVIDDAGIPKDGKHSPGVKRQYSGRLSKIGNCQIAVSLHAAGARGTQPLGFSLYLREEWGEDAERRRKAKIPDDVVFQTKPQLAAELIERAATWAIPGAPVLGDEAYGKNTQFARLPARRHRVRAEPQMSRRWSMTATPSSRCPRGGAARVGRHRARSSPTAKPRQVGDLAAALCDSDFQALRA